MKPWSAAIVLLAAAAASANDVEVVVSAKVAVGEQPRFTVKVHKDLKAATLDVKASGAKLRQTLGPAKDGEQLVFVLPHKAQGQLKWTGQLDVEFDDETTGKMPVSFATEVAGELRFKLLSDKDEMLRDNKVRVSMERPAGAVDVEVVGDDGELIANTSKKFAGEAPGTELEVPWIPRSGASVMKVTVVVHDSNGLYSKPVEFVPWHLEVPHEEVNFETGKADILPTEEPKLTAVLPVVAKALEGMKRARITTGKLYVLGHTDTVGSSASNRTLSFARARSIAKWFRAHGVQLPTFACGLGEDQLRVDTPDETDEIKNRRADYVFGVEGPKGQVSCPRVE